MKTIIKCSAATLLLACVSLALLPNLATSRHISRNHSHGGHHHGHHEKTQASIGAALNPESSYNYELGRRPTAAVVTVKPDTLQVAGSSLPDCSHACGSCFPCRLVMVSFVCATLEEAETCPMAYKCMCRNKSFPVP